MTSNIRIQSFVHLYLGMEGVPVNVLPHFGWPPLGVASIIVLAPFVSQLERKVGKMGFLHPIYASPTLIPPTHPFTHPPYPPRGTRGG